MKMKKRKNSLIRFILFLSVSSGIGVCPVWANSKPVTHRVQIQNMKFEPAVLEINRGDKVIWVNQDLVPHTVTAKSSFDSKLIQPDEKFQKVFKKKLEYHYYCRLHPEMKAILRVN